MMLGLRKDEGVGANRKKPQEKSERLEVHGDVQVKIIKAVFDLSKDYDTSPKGREAFWKAAKPIMGSISRPRMKKMLKRHAEIEDTAAKAKHGSTGATKRGYAWICKAWDEAFANKGIRKAGGGRKWYFKAHTDYLKNGMRWKGCDHMPLTRQISRKSGWIV